MCGLWGEARWRVTDKVWRVPGEWQYRYCRSCDVLWLDPRPKNPAEQALYPSDYITHAPPNPDLLAPRRGWIANLRLGVKIELLRRCYGYTLQCHDTWARLLGMVAAVLPLTRRWAGYTVMFLHAKNGRLLDVGCGQGTFLMLMVRLGWEGWGIEPDSVAAAYAQAQGLKVENRALEDTELEPESFDAITLHHVIEHLLDPVTALKKLTRALKPGGVLVSIHPNPDGMLARIFGPSWRGLDPPRHLVLLGPRGMADLTRKVGLQPVVWTTARNADWVARESISIRRHGDAFAYKGSFLPWLLSRVCCLLNLINGTLGEEVVLVARKPIPS